MSKEIPFDEYEKDFGTPSLHTWWNSSKTVFQHYQCITAHVERMAFPERKGKYYPPYMDGWSPLHKLLYRYSNPLAWFLESNRFLAFSYTWISFYIVLFWLISGISLLVLSYGGSLSNSPSRQLNFGEYIVSGAFLVATIVVIPAAYIRWIEFIQDKRYSKIYRITFSTFVVLGATALTFWIYSLQYRVFFEPFHLPENGLFFFIAYFLLLIPAFSFGLLLLFDSYAMLMDQIRSLFKDLYTLHYPLPFDLISKILYQPIEYKNDKWKLADLQKDELAAIRNWAESNRDSSEKRVTPTLFLVAIFGLFANTSLFEKLLEKMLAYLRLWLGVIQTDLLRVNSGVSFQIFVNGFVIVSFALAFTLILIFLFSSIFRNLIVQSLIIEACIIAEYAAQENEKHNKYEKYPESKKWWQKLFNL